jgi:hypothetical protein
MKDLNDEAKIVVALTQLQEASKLIKASQELTVDVVRGYYETLLKSGFSEPQTLVLTEKYQEVLMGG